MGNRPKVAEACAAPDQDAPLTPLDRAIEAIGGVAVAAEELKISRQAIYKWKAKGIPAERVLEIERLAKGRVRCYELRPDLYPRDMASAVPAT